VFYAGLEGEGGIDIVSKLKADGLMSPVKLEGDSPELGDFAIQFDEGIRSSPCQSAPVPQPKFH
jgi:mannosyl-oligosaccharide glucosidase